MKTLATFFVALFLLTLLATSSANESLGYCDQQLVQASASCNNDEGLEGCIMQALKDTGCHIEVASEDEVNFCNDSCAPTIATNLVSADSF